MVSGFKLVYFQVQNKQIILRTESSVFEACETKGGTINVNKLIYI